MLCVQLEIEVEDSDDTRKDNDCIERGRSRSTKQPDPQQGGNELQTARHRPTHDPAALWWQESNAVPLAQRRSAEEADTHHRLLMVRLPSLFRRLRRA